MRPTRATLAVFLAVVACQAGADLPVYNRVQTLALETSLGGSLEASDLEGRVHVVDFIFTSCAMACPLMTAQMHQIYEEFQDEDRVRFLSITTDPERDTVAVLHDYANQQGVDEQRWIFARAPEEELRRMSESEFLLAAADLPTGHSQRFVVIDSERRIRGFYDSGDAEAIERLSADVRQLCANLRRSD